MIPIQINRPIRFFAIGLLIFGLFACAPRAVQKKAIEKPDYLVKGWAGELLALRWCDIAPGAPKYICVVYREIRNEGFMITSFFISRYGKVLKRGIIWQKD